MVGIVRSDSSQGLSQLAGYGIAFVLLTWPLLWIAVGYVRYLLTGQSLERDRVSAQAVADRSPAQLTAPPALARLIAATVALSDTELETNGAGCA